MKKPIGCNAHHFYRQIGTDKVCMYCETKKVDWEKMKVLLFNIQRLWMQFHTELNKQKQTP